MRLVFFTRNNVHTYLEYYKPTAIQGLPWDHYLRVVAEIQDLISVRSSKALSAGTPVKIGNSIAACLFCLFILFFHFCTVPSYFGNIDTNRRIIVSYTISKHIKIFRFALSQSVSVDPVVGNPATNACQFLCCSEQRCVPSRQKESDVAAYLFSLLYQLEYLVKG